ncbi:MAG: carboxy-S-adenosyl-L-methionine synthase CmoA [Pseudomonadota bacterium]
MNNRDTVFVSEQGDLVDFAFDDRVARVFPDMIRRSVPGYDTVISLLGVVAEKYWQTGTAVVDIGCSLGAATLAMHHRLGERPLKYVCIDNSTAMIERCQQQLGGLMPEACIEYRCEDAADCGVEGASVVVMNFTLQFLPVQKRQNLVNRIHRQIATGGVLILSEKLNYGPDVPFDLLHDAFKSANGYSQLEISQKRSALENVMRIDSAETHRKRLQSAGFRKTIQWFQTLNFSSFLAVK